MITVSPPRIMCIMIRFMIYGFLLSGFLLTCRAGTVETTRQQNSTEEPSEADSSLAAFSMAGETFWIERFEVSQISTKEFLVRQGLVPVTGINYAEAKEICEARGLRICRLQEWKLACLGRSGHKFGYGSAEERSYCNVKGKGIEPTGYRVKCKSGTRIYDMVGNAGEWVFDERVDRPVVAGGSYADDPGVSCYTTVYSSPGLRELDVGVRCCK